MDDRGNFLQSLLPLDSSRITKRTYSPFLLEAAVAVGGMDVFNEYLKGM
jgi:hypothetical protein